METIEKCLDCKTPYKNKNIACRWCESKMFKTLAPHVKQLLKNAHRCPSCGDIVDYPNRFCDVACRAEYKKDGGYCKCEEFKYWKHTLDQCDENV